MKEDFIKEKETKRLELKKAKNFIGEHAKNVIRVEVNSGFAVYLFGEEMISFTCNKESGINLNKKSNDFNNNKDSKSEEAFSSNEKVFYPCVVYDIGHLTRKALDKINNVLRIERKKDKDSNGETDETREAKASISIPVQTVESVTYNQKLN